ncbi:helix-turn-helix domain-containing protein [Streptomyces sp. NPDC001709]
MSTRTGRPPSPVANAGNGIGELAEHLRKGRTRKALTREQLASKIKCSVTTIQRAEGGKIPPSHETLTGYIGVCDLDPSRTQAMWNKAVSLRSGSGRVSYTPAPGPGLVRTADELGAALARVWEENGRPSTREMERRADRRYRETRDYAPLSRSTAERISRRRSLPGSVRTLQAYLVACQVPEAKFPIWVQAWGRVHEKRRAAEEEARRQARKTSRIQAHQARNRMREAGLIPLDKFPGPVAPWSAVHIPCDQVSRYRLRAVLQGTAYCPVCDEPLPAGAGTREQSR